jgi:Flp pilus assembly protein TadG
MVVNMFKEIKDKENGQALVEMALVLPILIILIFGSIEIGRICFVHITINNAARAGVRVASTGGTDAAIIDAVDDNIIFDRLVRTIDISPASDLRSSGEEVTVNVSYPVTLIFPLIDTFIANPYIVNATYTMRLE